MFVPCLSYSFSCTVFSFFGSGMSYVCNWRNSGLDYLSSPDFFLTKIEQKDIRKSKKRLKTCKNKKKSNKFGKKVLQ